MKKIIYNGITYIPASEIPFRELIEENAPLEEIHVFDDNIKVFESGRLNYAAIVAYLKTINNAFLESINDSTSILDKLNILLNSMHLNNNFSNEDDVYINNSSKLLKVLYFLILATESGSDIVDNLLELIVSNDKIANNVYKTKKEYLDTLFNEYYGLGFPVCLEIIKSILNLIDFVKSSSR